MIQFDKQEKMKLIKQLQQFRLEKQISLQRLAKTLHIGYSTISKWERGITQPNKMKTYQIEQFLKKHKAL